jgi:hypothetical protein
LFFASPSHIFPSSSPHPGTSLTNSTPACVSPDTRFLLTLPYLKFILLQSLFQMNTISTPLSILANPRPLNPFLYLLHHFLVLLLTTITVQSLTSKMVPCLIMSLPRK